MALRSCKPQISRHQSDASIVDGQVYEAAPRDRAHIQLARYQLCILTGEWYLDTDDKELTFIHLISTRGILTGEWYLDTDDKELTFIHLISTRGILTGEWYLDTDDKELTLVYESGRGSNLICLFWTLMLLPVSLESLHGLWVPARVDLQPSH
jgi:hypothetical protein